MKKVITIILIFLPLAVSAQNIQLHYDMDAERDYFTVTHEMFRPDSLGSTFWFIDFDFNFPGSPRSMSAAYWEISRAFYIPGLKNIHPLEQMAIHVEYNDGFTAFETVPGEISGASYNSVFLAGLEYPFAIGNFYFGTQALARMPRGMESPGFQLTMVWTKYLFGDRLLFTGYMDFWSQDKFTGGGKELVYMTEPQLWLMVTRKIALGGEVEITKNFPWGPQDWQAFPTLGLRWEF